MWMHEELPSLELILERALSDISSPGVFRLSAAETFLRPCYCSTTGRLSTSLLYNCIC